MAMVLISMESYDIEFLGYSKKSSRYPDRKILVQNRKNGGKLGFSRGRSRFEIFRFFSLHLY